MTVNKEYWGNLQIQAFTIAKRKGFWPEDVLERIRNHDPAQVLAQLCLVHTEVSEAAECVREADIATRITESGKPEGFVTELADVVIRIANLAEGMQLDLGSAIAQKLEYNAKRAHRHGGKAL